MNSPRRSRRQSVIMGDIVEVCDLLAEHSDSDSDEGDEGFPENPYSAKANEASRVEVV